MPTDVLMLVVVRLSGADLGNFAACSKHCEMLALHERHFAMRATRLGLRRVLANKPTNWRCAVREYQKRVLLDREQAKLPRRALMCRRVF